MNYKFIPLFSNGSIFVPGTATGIAGGGVAQNVIPIIGNPGVNDTNTTFHTEDADAIAAGLGNTNGLDVSAFPFGWNGATWDRLRSLADNGDGQAALTLGLLATVARQQAWNGASWDRVRTPNVFKSVQASAAGNTAVWTPTAGKKFRLMGYNIIVSAVCTLAASGENILQLLDGAVAIGIALNPAMLTTIGAQGNDRSNVTASIGNGYLSILVNNVLNINVQIALASGNIRINVWGIEE